MHGVYNLHNIFVAMLARYLKIPYILTTHNGFAPNLSNIKKKLFDFIIQKKHVEKASAVHVITLEESTEILKILKPKKIILAHNGIDLEDFPVNENEINTKINQRLKIGYLGRLSKEKNLENVVKAMNELLDNGIEIDFYVAGPKSNYLKEVLSLNSSVKWVGPLYKLEKIDFIKSLDLFIHPSKADVFSITAIEVLALGTPLLITRTAKASYFYNSNSFFMCEPSIFGVKKGILEAVKQRENWKSMSKRGIELVKTTLNWDVICEKLIQDYKQIF
jgi:glycosyltransferase involved in cell wall biosynthesis